MVFTCENFWNRFYCNTFIQVLGKKRLKEADILVDYINTNKLDSLFLMGDMNAHSPMDADYLEK